MEILLLLIGILIAGPVISGIIHVLKTGKKKKAIEEHSTSSDGFSATRQAIGAGAEVTTPKNDQEPGVSSGSISDELKKLSDLRDTGVLTEEEFQKRKERLFT